MTPRRPAATPPPAPTHVALLRGVNVGGKNKLPMQDLAAACTALGCRAVRTYIQSGNVVFAASATVARGFGAALTAELERAFALHVPVVVRSAAELRATAASSPFAAADPALLHVGFLADRPTSKAVAALDPARSPGDEFVVRGREVHLCLRNGAAKTKLTNAWFDGRLGTICTIRNWRTVQQLVAMLDGQ